MTRKERIEQQKNDAADHAYTLLRGIMWGSLAALVTVATFALLH